MKTAVSFLIAGCLSFGGLPPSATGANVVSSTPRVSATGAGNSSVPTLSGDGRHVLFLSEARNLTTNDNRTPYLNVYLHDLATTNVTLVSVGPSGFGGGGDHSSAPTISSNGQWIAFQSAASNLANDDTNRVSDIFLRDVANGITMLLTRSTNAVWSANGASTTPLISSDGGRVVFESAARDLVLGDTNGSGDIFVFNIQSGSTTLVSSDAFAAGNTNGISEAPSISDDGRFVAFVKRAINQLNGGISVSEIYLRDVESESTVWVSAGVGDFVANPTNRFGCTDPSVSGNGNAVAFLVTNVLVNASYLYRYDRLAANSTLVASNVATRFTPALSGDARYLAYASGGALFVYDHLNGSNHLASACVSGGEPLTNCRAPSFSADGSRVAFLATQAGTVSAWVYNLATDCTQLVSLNTNGTAAAVVPSSYPTISRDGRTVTFEGASADLVASDYNQSVDVFIRNIEDGTTKLISRRAESLPTFSGMRPVVHTSGSVSADGGVLAFSSWDKELTEADPNTGIDLFIRDLTQGTIRRVEASSATTHAGYPSVSADGRYVAYLQNWTNMLWMDLATGINKFVEEVGLTKPTFGGTMAIAPLISPDGRHVAYTKPGSSGFNVFHKDMATDPPTTIPLSVRPGSSTLLPGSWAAAHAFSPDGKWLAFGINQWLGTNAPNLFETFRLYVRRLETAETRPLGIGSDTVTNAIFSADSRFVFFQNFTPPSSPSMMVARHDLYANPSNQIVCRECWNPSPSSDGQLVALQTFNSSLGANATNDVFVLNLANGQSNLVSMNFSGTGGGNGNSGSPVMSYDGRYVVFISKANNLVPNDTNNVADVFVRDLHAGTTLLVSRSFDGNGAANAVSFAPIMSADGRTVFFSSFASDLDPGDFNQARDIFALKLSGPDTDNDGMDDDWEMAHFNTLNRAGNNDYDGDRQIDLQEFRAGTNPTNNKSLLRVLTVTSMSSGSKTLLWAAAPGHKYQVQFKDSIDDVGWTDLPGLLTAAGTTGSKLDDTGLGSQHRFYRVALVP